MSIVAERIKELAKKQGITVKSLLEVLEINKGFVSDLSSRNVAPSADKLTKIADYFKVSVDYLLGRTDDPTPAGQKKASPEEIEAELIKTFHAIGIIGPDANPTQEQLDYLVKQFKIFADGYLKSDERK